MKKFGKSTSQNLLMNERGDVSQIITFAAGIGLFLMLILFGYSLMTYVLTTMEINSLVDDTMNPSMRIHNGLTDATRTYIEDALAAKGMDVSRVTIDGTEAGAAYGTEMEGFVEYEYQFPIISVIDSVFPFVSFETVTIRSSTHATALGVVR